MATIGSDLVEDTRYNLTIERFLNNRLAIIGLIITLVYVSIAVFGPMFITGQVESMDVANRFAPPGPGHLFGTDNFGRDVFARTVVGARLSLRVALAVAIISTILGGTLGLVAGYYRGAIDEAIMRVIDITLAFPSILLALVFIAVLGTGLNKAIIALAIAYTPTMARVVRGSSLSVREEDYVTAARLYGENDFNIMVREILPNVFSAVIVKATITFAFATLSEASLSYLGLSAQPPTPTWGVMISNGQNYIEIAPWVSVFPGLAIMLTVLGLTFLGVGLRDALDPKTKIEVGKGDM